MWHAFFVTCVKNICKKENILIFKRVYYYVKERYFLKKVTLFLQLRRITQIQVKVINFKYSKTCKFSTDLYIYVCKEKFVDVLKKRIK